MTNLAALCLIARFEWMLVVGCPTSSSLMLTLLDWSLSSVKRCIGTVCTKNLCLAYRLFNTSSITVDRNACQATISLKTPLRARSCPLCHSICFMMAMSFAKVCSIAIWNNELVEWTRSAWQHCGWQTSQKTLDWILWPIDSTPAHNATRFAVTQAKRKHHQISVAPGLYSTKSKQRLTRTEAHISKWLGSWTLWRNSTFHIANKPEEATALYECRRDCLSHFLLHAGGPPYTA